MQNNDELGIFKKITYCIICDHIFNMIFQQNEVSDKEGVKSSLGKSMNKICFRGQSRIYSNNPLP